MKTIILLLAMSCLFFTACGDPEPSIEQPLDCGQGDEIVYASESYCVYKSAITETGFNCPAAVPNRYDFEGGTVCGGKAMVTTPIIEKIGEQAKTDWNNTSPARLDVGKNAEFASCDEVSKSETYCAAERLVWTYNTESKTLNFKNTRASLNCCGVRSIKAFKNEDGSYELVETDKPEQMNGEGLRCNCTCVFDFGIDIPNVEAGQVDVTLTRLVTDSENEPKKTLWSGKLDIPEMAASDTILIDTNANPLGCMPGE